MRSLAVSWAVAALAALPHPLPAAEWRLVPGGTPTLPEALAAAAAGDRLRLAPGVYPGPLVIDRPLALIGEGFPVVDGGGAGTVISVTAPGVRIEGLTVRGSGDSLDQENSGIAVEAPGTVIRGNRLEEVLFGIYLREADGSRVAGNRILGKKLALARRGDAIRVWSSDRVVIEDNEVRSARDVVLWYSSDLEVAGNRVRDGRYGLHFMYCDDAVIRGNQLLDNSVGAFLMYSRRLRLEGNTLAGNHGPSGYGVGLKDMDDAEVRGNLFVGNRVGAFLDNSPREIGSRTLLDSNAFVANDVGVLLMPNVRRARLEGNAFLENGEQVGLGGAGGDPAANAWSENHWSDYGGFDADGDGFGDLPYRAEKLFENLADRSPELRLFRLSPAAGAIDFAARAFPAVRPHPKLTDPRPQMRAILPAAAPPLERAPQPAWRTAAAGLLGGALLLMALPAAARRAPGGRRSSAAPTSGSEPARPLIEVRRLTKRFGETVALDRVSFEVEAGESVALWGPNGAGKTTALRALLGLFPFTGEARVAGLGVRRGGKAARARVGYLPQEIAFQGDLTVEETFELFARLRRADRARIDELVDWLELDDHFAGPVRELSGGLKQRLALGLALLSDPPILLLDEPTSNLDPAARGSFFQLLLELRGRGKTLVFTSHRVDEVRILAERVLVLADGRVAADGGVDAVTLDGQRARLRVRVPEARRSAAASLLLEHGWGPRRLGPYLEVAVEPDRKAAPLAALLEAGIEVLDFELSHPFDSGSRDA